MRVDAQKLWEAVKNATLYCRERHSDGTRTFNGGEVQVAVDGTTLRVTASDDFVSVVTHVDVPLSNAGTPQKMGFSEHYIPYKQLKALELALRNENGKYSIALKEWREKSEQPEWWEEFGKVLDSAGKDPVALNAWEVNPERLALLSRLEPKGEYPLSWLGCKYEGASILAFRYGPKTHGIVIPLDREDLEDKHGEWLW